MRLPSIVSVPFLAGDGFLGLRCPCGFVVTARTPAAMEAGIVDHHDAVHLQSDDPAVHTEPLP